MCIVTVRLTDGTCVRFFLDTLATATGQYDRPTSEREIVEADATLLNVCGRVSARNNLLSGLGYSTDVRDAIDDYLDTIAAHLLPCYARSVDHAREFLLDESLAAARKHGLFIGHDVLDEMGDDLLDSLRRRVGPAVTDDNGALFRASEVNL